jgi:hypothetical protein
MTEPKQMMQVLEELRASCQAWLDDPRHAEDTAAAALQFEQFACQYTEVAEGCAEMAAWCRLGAGLLQGEDVPHSIHQSEDEDPADTARWKKWRCSNQTN